MSQPLKWEFPGGKVEVDETAEECLIREIHEELGILIEIKDKLDNNVHEYSNTLTINLMPYICQIQTGEITLKEHRQAKWMSKTQLLLLDWADADVPIAKNYANLY